MCEKFIIKVLNKHDKLITIFTSDTLENAKVHIFEYSNFGTLPGTCAICRVNDNKILETWEFLRGVELSHYTN